MTNERFENFASRTFVLADDNIDTDQIIPARFLTTTSRDGLGAAAFYDWRFDEDGRPRNSSVFNGFDPNAQKILVGGANFGCGSSREHAPWALFDLGFRAVVSTDIADIFMSNALKNGLLTITVDKDVHELLLASPGAEVSIDLSAQLLKIADGGPIAFAIEPFARRCLLDGVDPLGHLLKQIDAIAAFESRQA